MFAIKHQNPDERSLTRATIAIQIPEKLSLLAAVRFGVDKMPVAVGISWVHPKDQYVKKVGRRLAVEKAKWNDARLQYIEIRTGGRVVFHFFVTVNTPKGELRDISFGVSYLDTSERSRLEYAYVQ